MSQTAIALREENRDGRIRPSGVNSSMVTNIKDHITCTRSMDNYSSQDTKVGIVTFPCDFDHMYASMSEGMVSSKEKNEYKHLKDICLQHLDLIQQQSEIIARQEKQIQSLQQEKERLKQRLQRSHRRPGHQKLLGDGDNTDAEANYRITPTSRRHRSPSTSETVRGPRQRSTRSFSPKESSQSPVQWENTSTQRRQSEDGRASVSSECEMHDDSSTTTVSQRSALKGKRIAGLTRQRQQRKRTLSSVSREGNADNDENQESTTSEGPLIKRIKKEIGSDLLPSEAGAHPNNAVLTTSYPYHTATGSTDSGWTLNEMCIETDPEPNGDVLEIPQWRVKMYTSLYSMEGTENLDDEVFLKRHHRLEVDERRRKRWDVQRIREQRHIEKLKQREQASSSALGGSSKGDGGCEETISTLWPIPDDAQYLQVADELPVAAFGLPISKFTPSEFSLPWLEEGASAVSQITEKKAMRCRKSTSNSTLRKRKLGRGGGNRLSLSLSGKRGDAAERK